MNFILNHSAAAAQPQTFRSSVKVCQRTEPRVERTSRKGCVSNINIDTPQYSSNKLSINSANIATPSTNLSTSSPQGTSDISNVQHGAGRAIQRKDDRFENKRANCMDRIQAQRQLSSQIVFGEMAVFAEPILKKQRNSAKEVCKTSRNDIENPSRKIENPRDVVGRAPRNNMVRDNDKDYGDVCNVQKRVIVNDYDKNFKEVTCPKKREIVNNYDKNYSEVTKPKKREFNIDYDKNYSDITVTKKREIKREHVEIEGSKPKKFNYDRKGPEITVQVCGDDGPKLMKKCLKTQRFICAVQAPANSDANFHAGGAAKVRTHLKQDAPKNLNQNRVSCNPILGQTRPGETFGWFGGPKRQRLSVNDNTMKSLMTQRDTQKTVSSSKPSSTAGGQSRIPRVSAKTTCSKNH